MGKQKKAATKKTQNPVYAARNKKLKQERHEKQVLKFQMKAIETEKLLTLARELLHVGSKAGVKRIVGTLNFNRLSDVIENRYLFEPWFLQRQIRLQEKKYVRKGIPPKAPTEEKAVSL